MKKSPKPKKIAEFKSGAAKAKPAPKPKAAKGGYRGRVEKAEL